ncbi:unnamed protein product [Rhodiola kirilowii]
MMRLSLSGIRRLITDVAENARFREETTRQDEFSRTKNVARAETRVNSIPEEMKQIKEMMIQILRKQTVQVRPCEFCGSTDHKTDACPTLIEEDPVEANAVEGYQGYNNNNNNRAGPNRHHPPRETQQAAPQPAQSFYQPPHWQYNQNAHPMGQYQQKGQNQYQAGPSNQQGPSKSLEDIVKELASYMHQLRIETKGELSDLKKQMSQLATSMSALTNEPGRLPSQTIQNPKGNVSSVTLRSGRKLVVESMEQEEDEAPKLPEEERDVAKESRGTAEERRPDPVPAASPVPATEEAKECPVPRIETSKISASLPFLVPA